MGGGRSKATEHLEAFMTAVVLPDIDRATLAELRDRMPSLRLSEIELPSLEHAGRDADRAIDRLIGRSRPSIWPWVLAGVAVAAIVGASIAFLTWFRRPAWPDPSPPWPRTDAVSGDGIEPAGDAAELEPHGFITQDDRIIAEGGRP
jgi:hypothetical protein